jgi:TonB-dependent receptor
LKTTTDCLRILLEALREKTKPVFLCAGFVFLTGFPVTAFANGDAGSGRIVGRVTGRSTSEPLIGANVQVKGTMLGAATDLDGKFRMNAVPAGTVIITVTYLGFNPLEKTVTVPDGGEVTVNFEMDWAHGGLDEAPVSEQTKGQIDAANRQWLSNTISNSVAGDRVKELPDVNVVESIGRLPGVSIQRSGGEANKIVIRGLSPKYNTVTVNGVRVPSTDVNDRSVDLSLISSNMIDGIEVTKALTADKDADATGGSVDLKLKTADDAFFFNAQTQGGYTALQQYRGNYKTFGTVSNRFFNKKFGVLLSFNAEEYDRSSDKLNGMYGVKQNPGAGGELQPAINNLSLTEEKVLRGRKGGTIILDYRLPGGKVLLNGFYNRLTNDGYRHSNNLEFSNNRHVYALNDFHNETGVSALTLGLDQSFGRISYDARIARTASRNNTPDDLSWDFLEAPALTTQAAIDQFGGPDVIVPFFRNDLENTYLNSLGTFQRVTRESEITAQANLKWTFQLGPQINGYVKAGYKYRAKDRSNDEERSGRSLYYGGGQELRDLIALGLPELGLVTRMPRFPMEAFLSNRTRSNFLGGNYPLGYVIDADKAAMLTYFSRPYMYYSGEGSLANDYSGTEVYNAAYAMTGINIGNAVTLLPGFRFEREETDYAATFARDRATTTPEQRVPHRDTTATRDQSFLLPQVHLKIKGSNWLTLRLAYTQSIIRPDFNQLAPVLFIDEFNTYGYAGNTNIKSARSHNLDAALSVYQSKLGSLTVAGFYKKIEDLLVDASFVYMINHETGLPYVLPDLQIPNLTGWPVIHTSLNNKHNAYQKGIEIDWQTNFWYLPPVLKGLVLNVNMTWIRSETRYPEFTLVTTPIVPRPPRPSPGIPVIREDTTSGSLPDTPPRITNVTLGYDYKGFSIRTSYLHQAGILGGAQQPVVVNRIYNRSFHRLDINISQKVTRNVQVFCNLNNLNNQADRSFQWQPGFPTNEQFFGPVYDLGIRMSLH